MSFREVVISGNDVQEVQNMQVRFETMVGELVPSYYAESVRPVSSRQKLVPLAPIAVHIMTDLRNYFFSERQKKNPPAAALLWTFREDRDHPAHVLSSYGRRSPYAGKSRYQGKPTWHTVRPNELMADISREYSIALSALYKRNLLEAGSEVAAGQLVKLKGGKVDNAPLVISNRLGGASPVPKEMRSGQTYFRPDPLLRPSREKQGAGQSQEKPLLPAVGGVEPLPLPIIPKPGKTPSSLPPEGGEVSSYHIVQQGDTLYGISRKYGVSVGMLKSLNGLHSDSIVSGTVLRIR
jgi:LysM repeat protein